MAAKIINFGDRIRVKVTYLPNLECYLFKIQKKFFGFWLIAASDTEWAHIPGKGDIDLLKEANRMVKEYSENIERLNK